MSDDKFIDAPPQGAAGWREVWSEDRRHPPAGGLLRRFVRWIDLMLTRASGEARRQREFNIVVLDLLADLRGDIREELAAVRDDFRKQADEIMADLRAVNADLSRDISDVDTRIHTAVRRGDALVAAVDRKIESLAARTRDLTSPVLDPAASPSTFRSDFVYRRMEDALRGSESEVRESSRHYLKYAKEKSPVIDVGCGRGEFLQLCDEEGLEAKGYDSNERAVSDLLEKGLDADLGTIPGCLTDLEAGSVGTIVAIHVVEHLPFAELFALLTESARALVPGGFLAIETPNADSLVSSAAEFWKDPTHLGPRHQAALVTLAREVGFDVEELVTTAPFPSDDLIALPAGATSEVTALVDRLNQLLYGDRNLRLVLKRRA